MDYTNAHRLAEDIRQSEEYRTYQELKAYATADETVAALVHEYRKVQTRLQMSAMSGNVPDETDVERFKGLANLLFGNEEMKRYLLAEIRLQQVVTDIFRIVNQAAGVDLGMPDL